MCRFDCMIRRTIWCHINSYWYPLFQTPFILWINTSGAPDSTNKNTDCHNINEIMQKLVYKTYSHIPCIWILFNINFCNRRVGGLCHRPLGSVVNLNWSPQEQPLTSEINNSNCRFKFVPLGSVLGR